MNFQKTRLPAGLYFVAVPIGTARDITLRALDVLASADILAAEDTRSLRHLMDIHAVPLSGRQMMALHDHSSKVTTQKLVRAIKDGHSVAYASEAGMPLIADPGFELARGVVADNLFLTCAPGPSAVLNALVLAGLPTDAFFFGGFLPNTSSGRLNAMERLRGIPGTLVFYESPKRLAAMLEDACIVLGAERQAVVCRELTKKFEEVTRGTLGDLAEAYKNAKVKGEVVVLIDRERSDNVMEDDLEQQLRDALDIYSMRDAVDLVAKANAVPRRRIYKLALAMKEK
ncbi:MAG: 16S rRNA (cytidine(1402)-2'-O)-methyltransferase [Pseudomonadota bacterium]